MKTNIVPNPKPIPREGDFSLEGAIVLPRLMPAILSLYAKEKPGFFPAKGNLPVMLLAASDDTVDFFNKNVFATYTLSTGLWLRQQLPLFLQTVWLDDTAFTFGFDAGQPEIIKALRRWARIGYIPVVLNGSGTCAVGKLHFSLTTEMKSFLRCAGKTQAEFSRDRWRLHKAGIEILKEALASTNVGNLQPVLSDENFIQLGRWKPEVHEECFELG